MRRLRAGAEHRVRAGRRAERPAAEPEAWAQLLPEASRVPLQPEEALKTALRLRELATGERSTPAEARPQAELQPEALPQEALPQAVAAAVRRVAREAAMRSRAVEVSRPVVSRDAPEAGKAVLYAVAAAQPEAAAEAGPVASRAARVGVPAVAAAESAPEAAQAEGPAAARAAAVEEAEAPDAGQVAALPDAAGAAAVLRAAVEAEVAVLRAAAEGAAVPWGAAVRLAAPWAAPSALRLLPASAPVPAPG